MHTEQEVAVIEPTKKQKRDYVLQSLAERYGYSVNTMRIYIAKGKIFSTKNAFEVYDNISRSDKEMKDHQKSVKKSRQQNLERLRETVPYSKRNQENVSSSEIAVKVPKAEPITPSMFDTMLREIEFQMEKLNKEKEAIELVQNMYQHRHVREEN